MDKASTTKNTKGVLVNDASSSEIEKKQKPHTIFNIATH